MEKTITKEDKTLVGNLDTNFLKTIGVFTMLLDHVGKTFYPDLLILQVIGRIAYPVFAYCVVVGIVHTSNVYRYALRLAIFGLISQPFYMLAFGAEWYILNIYFTLLMGLLILTSLQSRQWFIAAGLLIIASFADLAYGLNGILLMVILYYFRNKKTYSMISVTLLFFLSFFSGSDIVIRDFGFDIQGFAILSIPFIFLKTDFKLRLNKYVFYLFYPLHLGALYGLTVWMHGGA